MSKQFSAACERNREPILAILKDVFVKPMRVLEIGSGTGQHAVYFGQHLPHVTWQTGDLPANHPSICAWLEEAGLPNVLLPLAVDVGAVDWQTGSYDAVFSANTCHIMAWPQVEQMFAGFPHILSRGGLVCIYGPFNYGGNFTSASNAAFDASLREQAAHRGIRDIEAMQALAEKAGLQLLADNAMPAHNRLLVWQRI
jgi:cyclopropane fatty-acyl-phospholipid synthase-like methyltransferase